MTTCSFGLNCFTSIKITVHSLQLRDHQAKMKLFAILFKLAANQLNSTYLYFSENQYQGHPINQDTLTAPDGHSFLLINNPFL